MRVVIFLPSIETGGVERNAIILANNLATRGDTVDIVHTRIVEKMRERFHPSVALRQIGKRWAPPWVHPRIVDAFTIFIGFITFLKRLPAGEPTVIVSFQSNIIAVCASWFAPIPIVVRVSNHPSHVRYESGKVQKIAELLKRVIYRFADVIVTNSEVTSDCYRKVLSVPVETIYNPVNRNELKVKADVAVTHHWLLDHNKPVIVSVGRLSTQKNFFLLIEAFSKVLDKLDARLIVLGEGGERGKLEALIEHLGLIGKVDLVGYDQNVHRFVSRADLFVLSSNFEGMPNALIEAIAVGTPAVATNCLSGPSEVLLDGEGGDLVPIGDADALARAIVANLLDQESTREKHHRALRHLDRFEESMVMGKYADLLMRLANGR